MPVMRQLQNNFSAGVMDVTLEASEDLKAYYNAVSRGLNVIFMPSRGFRRRGALRRVGKPLKQLVQHYATVAPSTSGTIGNTADFVIWSADIGAAISVCRASIEDYLLSSGSALGLIVLQYSTDNSTWNDFAEAFNWAATARSRQLVGQATGRYWRIIRKGATSIAATGTVGAVRLWGEGDTESACRLMDFSFSEETYYMMLLTAGNIDVYRGGHRVGAVRIPHGTADLKYTNWTQSLDTMLLFNASVAPWRVFRQGGDDEWDYRAQVYDNTPQYDYGAGVGGVDEVQTLGLGGFDHGNLFSLLLEGEKTLQIAYDPTVSTTASSIQTALRSLSNTSATGITVSGTNATTFVVTFSGDDGKRPWLAIEPTVMSGAGVMTVQRTTKGEYPGEDVFSAGRGYPETGTIYQARHHLGGMKSRTNAWLASTARDLFDFDTSGDLDDAALDITADDGKEASIYHIVAARHLSFFTNGGCFYVPTEPIKQDASLKKTTGSACKRGIRPHEVDGAVLFVQPPDPEDSVYYAAKNDAVREFLFSDVEQSYTADAISTLSSSLLRDVVDSAHKRGTPPQAPDMLFYVNVDGTCAVLTTLRVQNFTAFSLINTRGDILNAGVDGGRVPFFIVRRFGQLFFERMDDTALLDGGDLITAESEMFQATDGQVDFTYGFDAADYEDVGVRIDGAKAGAEEYTVDLDTKTVSVVGGLPAGSVVRLSKTIATISGLADYEGQALDLIVDGNPLEEAVLVAGGVIALPVRADTSVEYGFDFPVEVDSMPVAAQLPDGTISSEKKRITRLVLSLYKTGDIAVGANGQKVRSVHLGRVNGAHYDMSAAEQLYTGQIEISGLKGWTRDGRWRIRQLSPSPLWVRSVMAEVSV